MLFDNLEEKMSQIKQQLQVKSKMGAKRPGSLVKNIPVTLNNIVIKKISCIILLWHCYSFPLELLRENNLKIICVSLFSES